MQPIVRLDNVLGRETSILMSRDAAHLSTCYSTVLTRTSLNAGYYEIVVPYTLRSMSARNHETGVAVVHQHPVPLCLEYYSSMFDIVLNAAYSSPC
jgi:hypothetical protein